MTSFQVFALVWPAVVAAIVVAIAFLSVWLDERALRRKV